MRWRVLAIITLLLAWVMPARVGAREIVAAQSDDPIGVVQVRLDNGLTVWLSENHARAEVFGAVVVDVGGKDDPKLDTGMAHYLEHMLFKGTTELGTTSFRSERPWLRAIEAEYEALAAAPDAAARRRIEREIDALSKRASAFAIPNEMDRVLSEMGGSDVNAFTTNDYTVYHNVFPASQIENWLEVYAHRFREPVFRLFAPELEAVYEEKNASMDGFIEPAYETFMRRFFPGHAYGRPVLGEVEHLKRPSLRAMREHFETWYVANNMALVLAGDFDTDAILPIIEEKFGTWKSGELPFRDVAPVRPFGGREVANVRLTPIRAAAIGYRTPPRGHPDHPALLVARELLANEQQSGALDRLAADGKLLFARVMRMDFHDLDGTVIFYSPRLLFQSFARAEALVQAELEKLRSGAVPSAEVAAVRTNLLRDIELQWESNQDRAYLMADTWARGQAWSDYLAMVKALRTIDVPEVAAASRRWLGGDFLMMRSRRGTPARTRLDKPEHTGVVADPERQSAYAKRMRAALDRPVAPRLVEFDRDVQRHTPAPGLVVAANPNPFNAIYRLELRFGVGRYDEPALDVLAEYLPRAGTEQHPRDRFAQRLFELGTTLDAIATADRFVLRLQGPEDRLEDALALVRELMTQPAFDRRRRGQVRRERWASERLDRSDPNPVSHALWEHVLFGDRSIHHRYGHRALRRYGVRDVLKAWTVAQSHALEVRWVGRRSIDSITTLVADRLAVAAVVPAIDPIERERLPIERDRVYFVPRRDAVQSQVWFFIEGESVDPAEAPAMDAFNEYMGGSMGGLVFQEIRELRALAYSAFGGFHEPDLAGRPGYFYGFVGCQADKTADAIEVMRALVTDLPRKPERVVAARAALLRSQESADPEFRDLQAWIEKWRRRGYDRDPRRDRMAAYPKLALADVEGFWKRHIAGRPIALLVVGDPRRVDRKMLEQHGPVTVLRTRQLYRPSRRR